MKILLVSALPPPYGGISIWTKRILEYTAGTDLSYFLVNTAVNGRRANNLLEKRKLSDEIRRTLRIYKDLKDGVKKIVPDLVHINSPCTFFSVCRDLPVVFWLHQRKVPVIIHCRCNIEDQIGNGIIQNRLLSAMLRKASKCIVLNTQSQQYLHKKGIDKTVVVPNFIEDKWINSDRKPSSACIKTAVYTGRVSHEKGFDTLLQAAKEVPEVQFFLYGKTAPQYENAVFSKTIHIMGEKSPDELMEILREADCYVFPSLTEGFSNSLAEAMASGLPVVATDVGANRDMIEKSGGIIIQKENSAELVNAIKKIDDQTIRESMSEWNIAKVKRCYTIENVVNTLKSIYKEVLGKS